VNRSNPHVFPDGANIADEFERWSGESHSLLLAEWIASDRIARIHSVVAQHPLQLVLSIET
jgi:hypothetical protein